MPARAAYRKKVSRLAPPKFRERKSDRGTMGEAERASTIRKPASAATPSAAVIEVKPDHVPMARPRSLSEKEALSSARLPGTSNAAPAPCTPRAAIKKEIEGANPHKADPTANRTIPIMKIFARP